MNHPEIDDGKQESNEKKDVVSKDSKEVQPREKQKRKQVSTKTSKGSDSNALSAPKKPKKAEGTPQQNSNLRTAK